MIAEFVDLINSRMQSCQLIKLPTEFSHRVPFSAAYTEDLSETTVWHASIAGENCLQCWWMHQMPWKEICVGQVRVCLCGLGGGVVVKEGLVLSAW